jgi:hypothetical protein
MAKILMSVCCEAEALVGGKTTHYYTCPVCGQPCDVYQAGKSVDKPPKDKMIRRGGKVRIKG